MEKERKKRDRQKRKYWVEEKEVDFLQLFSPRIQKVIVEEGYLDRQDLPSAYLYGKIGTGKTIKAVQLMLGFAHMKGDLNSSNYFFANTTEILSEIRASFDDNSIVQEKDIINRLTSVRYLILDDLGIDKVTNWVYQVLYLIINKRYEKGLHIIVTSNLSIDELDDFYKDGGRISSRLYEMCDVVEKMKGNNKRIYK